MMNLFEENENYENQTTNDLLQMLNGPITGAVAKKVQEVFNGLVKKFI